MFKLEPEAAESVADLPNKNASITREPEEVLALGQPLGLGEKGLKLLRVKTGHFTVNASVGMPKKADRLVVTFAGARRDTKGSDDERRPFLARRKWMPVYQGAVLALSDPQTDGPAAMPGARTGFYMGSFAHDLVLELLALVDQVCDELKIPRGRVVFYGAGAGGASAMLVASRRKSPTGVIAVNPLLRPEKYGDAMVAAVARAAQGQVADWEKLRTTNTGRNNPLAAFRDGLTDGHDLRLVVAQNLKDLSTVNRHFPGLWRRFEMDPHGGVASNGRVMILTYEGPETNRGEEPPEFTRPLLARAYAFLDGPVVPGAVYQPPAGEATTDEDGPADDDGEAAGANDADAGDATSGARAGKPDKAAKAAAKAEKTAAREAKKSARADKPANADRPAKPAKADKPAKAVKADKPAKPAKADKPAKAAKGAGKAKARSSAATAEDGYDETMDDDVADLSGD